MSLLFRESTELQDEIDYLTSAVQVSPFSRHVLVYYVAGNPGLIEYYRNFLKFLTLKLSRHDDSTGSSPHQTQYHVHGESLAGFQLQKDQKRRTAYSLNDIKRNLAERIEHKAAEIIDSYGLKQKTLPVILIGHSIGTWLILETIESARTTNEVLQTAEVIGGILLFPTVFELAKSPNGLRAGWLLRFEYTAWILSLIASILFRFIPLFAITAFLQLLLQMPHHSALTTASFLKSRGGVHQALYMAHGELLQVCEDTWSDELWGVKRSSVAGTKEARLLAKSSTPVSAKLYFYWGANDHWVANTTRDTMISRRAHTAATGDENKPVMEVDKHDLPHAFSLHDTDAKIVADKVATWIGEL